MIKKQMKKCIAVICAASILMTMVSCSSDDNEGSENKNTTAATEQTLEEKTTTDEATSRDIQTENTAEAPKETTTEATTTQQTTTVAQGTQYPTQSTDGLVISNEADQFFVNSVFVGDSVMMGFNNYVRKKEAGFLGNPSFLTAGSFSVRWALMPISNESVHPTYQGRKVLVEDGISLMGAKKAFLFFGINDLGLDTVENVKNKYVEVIDRIKAKNPGIKIYVISTTSILSGKDKGTLSNANIRALNQKMQEVCASCGYGYIDIASYVTGADGCLKPEYCSDGFLHETYAAYDVWTQVLRNYATQHMND